MQSLEGRHLNFQRVKRRLNSAVELLRIKDFYLLKNNLSERAITHKLAEHLQYVFANDFDVDCEYNRDADNSGDCKKLFVLESRILEVAGVRGRGYETREFLGNNYYDLSVFPDIIVHKRGSNSHNLLAIEVKKATSNVSREYDFLKLENYTESAGINSLKYKYGVFIRLYTGSSKYQVPEIIWFENGIVIHNETL